MNAGIVKEVFSCSLVPAGLLMGVYLHLYHLNSSLPPPPPKRSTIKFPLIGGFVFCRVTLLRKTTVARENIFLDGVIF
jgi:hypothetical protein